RPFFKDLVAFMTSGPVVLMVLEGENAIAKNREIMGATNPANAAPGTIRKDFATNVERNTVHGSDSAETAKKEIAYFFTDREMGGKDWTRYHATVRRSLPPVTPDRRPTAAYSPGFVRLFTRLFWWFARPWFRPTIEGWERIPPAPCVFVGNHSGYGGFEILVMLTLWYRRFGFARPVGGLSHDVGLKWPLRWLVSRIGGIRASPA